MHCIFCEIVRGNAPAEILYENPHAIAILDINPIHYGHALVLPKQHRVTYVDMQQDEMFGVMEAIQVVTGAVVRSLQPAGFNIFSNNGKAAGQSIFHCHFHITPRYEDDKIQFLLELKKYPVGELGAYAEKLRQHIQIHQPVNSVPQRGNNPPIDAIRNI